MKSKQLKDETQDTNIINTESAGITPHGKKPFLKRYIALILSCLVILLSLTAAYFLDPGLLSGVSTRTPSEMYGLEVDNFTLSAPSDDVYLGSLENFYSFFLYGAFSSFVVVKVNSVQSAPLGHQVSNVTVLSPLYTIWDSEKASETLLTNLQVNQTGNTFGDYTLASGASNFLREGGVYILPVEYDGGRTYVIGDLNVLFEIDNKGKVWSHSNYKEFNAFDGKDASALISKLQKISSNNDFKLAQTSFWNILHVRNLADVTLSGKTGDNYSFSVNKILSTAPVHFSYNNQNPDTADFSKGVINDAASDLEVGSRYLIIFGCHDGIVDINGSSIAKIQDDGTIKALPAPDYSANSFSDYEGYNLSDIKNTLNRVKPWLVYFYKSEC